MVTGPARPTISCRRLNGAARSGGRWQMPSSSRDLLARRTIPGRPPELSDDLDWILAASGRAGSGDDKLPLIG